MAANQGLYNGFLAAGLVWGLIAGDPTGYRAQVFFLVLCDRRRRVRRRHRQPPHPVRPGPARRARPGRRPRRADDAAGPRAARTRGPPAPGPGCGEALLDECAEHPLARDRRGRAGPPGGRRPGHLLRALSRPGGAGRRRLRRCRTGGRGGAARLARPPRPGAAPRPRCAEFFAGLAPHAALYRALLAPGRRRAARPRPPPGPARLQPRANASSRAPRTPRWSPPPSPPPSPGSSPTGCTASSTARPSEIADQVWQLLVALHRSR